MGRQQLPDSMVQPASLQKRISRSLGKQYSTAGRPPLPDSELKPKSLQQRQRRLRRREQELLAGNNGTPKPVETPAPVSSNGTPLTGQRLVQHRVQPDAVTPQRLFSANHGTMSPLDIAKERLALKGQAVDKQAQSLLEAQQQAGKETESHLDKTHGRISSIYTAYQQDIDDTFDEMLLEQPPEEEEAPSVGFSYPPPAVTEEEEVPTIWSHPPPVAECEGPSFFSLPAKAEATKFDQGSVFALDWKFPPPVGGVVGPPDEPDEDLKQSAAASASVDSSSQQQQQQENFDPNLGDGCSMSATNSGFQHPKQALDTDVFGVSNGNTKVAPLTSIAGVNDIVDIVDINGDAVMID